MHESPQLELNDGLYVAIQMLKSNRRFAACRHYLFLTQNVVKVNPLDIRDRDCVLNKFRALKRQMLPGIKWQSILTSREIQRINFELIVRAERICDARKRRRSA